MTLQDKHTGIAAGIAAGGSNQKLADQHGVSRGMIQKHRARPEIGESLTWKTDDPFIEPYFYHRENAEFLDAELELRECRAAIYDFLRENEKLCRNCRCLTRVWICPNCGANALLEDPSEKATIIKDMIRCECGLFSWTGICPVHGPLPRRDGHRRAFQIRKENTGVQGPPLPLPAEGPPEANPPRPEP